MKRFTVKDFERELTKELKMREKVWPRDYGGKFKNPEHNRRYDVMLELLEILENCPLPTFEKLRAESISAKNVIQTSMIL